ncbi:MAG: lysophospholipid acyltransferase family protein, partial [candidate division Zixibacteria bacterium]
GSAIGREIYFLAKKELFKNLFLRVLISSLNSIPVKRGVFDRSALLRAETVLKNGYGLIFFPEGTRSKTGELGKGKPGIGMLARKAMVPILPVYIKNSKGFLSIPFSSRRLSVSFGPPLTPEKLAGISDDKDGYREIAALVMEEIQKLKDSLKA